LAIVEILENAIMTMPADNSKSGTLQESFAICLRAVDEVVAEVRRRIEESHRMDDLLRSIGVSHGRTLEETIELEKEHAEERNEYQALQDAYLLTVKRISTVAAQARQCLVDGFPATEQISDKLEDLMIRYGKMEVRSDIFVLKVRDLIRRASEIISPGVIADSAAGQERAIRGRGRTPDIETSRERIALYDQFSTELATIYREVKKYTTVEKLKTKYPDFKLWEMLSQPEQRDLIAGGFRPKLYAGHLTIRKYGLTSLSTLKKDRTKLRNAQRQQPQV
jgi:hypothetical protein